MQSDAEHELPPVQIIGDLPPPPEALVTQITGRLGSELAISVSSAIRCGSQVVTPLGQLFVDEFPHHFHERTINLTNGGSDCSAIVSKVPADAVDITKVCKFFEDFGVVVCCLPIKLPIISFDTLSARINLPRLRRRLIPSLD